MIQLSQAIQKALETYRDAKVSESTYSSRQRYCKELQNKATSIRKIFFDQELVDAYLRDDRGSKEVQCMHKSICKKIDAFYHLKLIDLNGRYLNSPRYPSNREAEQCFSDNYPHNKQSIPYVHLVIKTHEVVKGTGVTTSTSGQYLKALKDFSEWALFQGHTYYSLDDCEQWQKYNDQLIAAGTLKDWVWKIRRRSIFLMKTVVATGEFSWRQITNERFPLSDELAQIENKYIHDREIRGLSKKTLQLYRYVAHYALYAYGTGASQNKKVAEIDISDTQRMLHFFSGRCNKTSMGTIVPILRSFLNYMSEQGVIQQGVVGFVQTARHPKRSAKGFFPTTTENRIVRTLGAVSKRDKAIIILAMETGLRECDILSMEFSHIDWNKDIIAISQQKTGKSIVLPLLPDVGNALSDYIFNERPKVPAEGHKQYIFLRKQAPYRRLTGFYNISCSIYEFAQAHPINSLKTGGLHLLRHTLAYRLLKNKVPSSLITQVLGHTDRDSDKSYLSLDDAMLMECAMRDPLPVIEEAKP